MDQDDIIQYITDTFAGVEVQRPDDGPGAGDTFFFTASQRDVDPTRRQPFATIVTKDYGEFDNLSQLDRPGVFRLNIGVSRETFQKLFGYLPGKQNAESAEYDYAALDRLMPHPVYAPQSFVCVLNPSPETFKTVKPLLAEAYSLVEARHSKPQTDQN
ncbi:MAG TPA: DUF6194 family protein [Ktedonobacterales bacterium]|jgi:hypothetical protein